MIRPGFLFSICFHAVVMALAWFGLPELRKDIEIPDTIVMVDLVEVSDVTNAMRKPAPPEPKKPDPKKVEEKPAPPPEPPKPEPVKEAAPPPEPPKPEPAPEPEEVVVIKEEPKKKEPKPEPRPKPEPKPVEKPKPKAPESLARVKVRKKPKPPDAFASVLKTVEKLKAAPKPKEQPEKKQPTKAFDEQIAAALLSKNKIGDNSKPVTISEIDLVRQQIRKCWSVPAGAKDAQSMQIEIRVNMRPDGRTQSANLVSKSRMSDPFYRTMAESALRAVLNPRCQPFKLPPEKYASWNTLVLNFDTKEMFGQ